MILLVIPLLALIALAIVQAGKIAGLKSDLDEVQFQRDNWMRLCDINVDAYFNVRGKLEAASAELRDLRSKDRDNAALNQNLTNTIDRCSQLLNENRELKRRMDPDRVIRDVSQLMKETLSEAKRNEKPAQEHGGIIRCYGTINGCKCPFCCLVNGCGAV